jgi:hypothetical protein
MSRYAIIDSQYAEFKQLVSILDGQGEISLRASLDSVTRKALLLSAASLFESFLVNDLIAFCEECAGPDQLVSALVRNKALKRQYHTLFDWTGKNANAFFGLFGERFADHMKQCVDADEQLAAAVEAFIVLGRTRNDLVHRNFATFPLEPTADEIYQLFRRASHFVDLIPQKLREVRAGAAP